MNINKFFLNFFQHEATLFMFLFLCLSASACFINYGDQFHYAHYFESISDKDLITTYSYYFRVLSAKEPVYHLISWIFSKYASRDVFVLCLNLYFFTLVYFTMRKQGVSKIDLVLCFTNFYFLVLFFSAERLKIGLMFILLALLFNRCFWVFIILAFFSHFQLFLLLPAFIVLSPLGNIDKKISSTGLIKLISLLVILLMGVFFVRAYLITKILFYVNDLKFDELVKNIFLLLLAIYLVPKNKRISVLISYSALIPASLVLSGGRVTILSFMLLMFFFFRYKKENAFVTCLLFYFSLKGISFLLSGYFTGDGFALSFLNVMKLLSL